MAKSDTKQKRSRIDAKPVLEAVEDVPGVTRAAASRMYGELVSNIVEQNQPGSWFRVFKGLPSISSANSRATAIKEYEDMEAVSRSNPDGTADVYARHDPGSDARKEAEAAEAEKAEKKAS